MKEFPLHAFLLLLPLTCAGCGVADLLGSAQDQDGAPPPIHGHAISPSSPQPTSGTGAPLATPGVPVGSPAADAGAEAGVIESVDGSASASTDGSFSEASSDASVDTSDAGAPSDTVGLDGANVTWTSHCCTAPPSAANLIAGPLRAVVGPGVEFNTSDTQSNYDQAYTLIDISANQIEVTFGLTSQFGSGDFNGLELDFSRTSPPLLPIMGTSLDTATTFKGTVGLSSNAASVFINVAGQPVTGGDRIVVDVTF